MPAVNLDRLLSARSRLQEQLPEFIRARRWFGGKARPMQGVDIVDTIVFDAAERACFLLVRVRYQAGPAETYSVPLIEATGTAEIPPSAPHLRVLAEDGAEMVLYDATSSAPFLESLLESIREQRSFPGQRGRLRAAHTPALAALAPSGTPLPPKLMRAEQSNSSVAYGDRLILKLFRRLEEGENPDLEIGRFLTEKTGFRNLPPLAGYLDYGEDGSRMSLAMLQSFVPNRGDAWEFTLQAVQQFLGRALHVPGPPPPAMPALSLPQLAAHDLPPLARQLIGDYLDSARLLGRRTAELHLALAGSRGDPAFDPEPFAPADQQALCASTLELLRISFRLLRQQLSALPAAMQKEARQALELQPRLERRLRFMETRPLTAQRTRIHGDYHLGQVLVSGDDFFIIDFEGEPGPFAGRAPPQALSPAGTSPACCVPSITPPTRPCWATRQPAVPCPWRWPSLGPIAGSSGCQRRFCAAICAPPAQPVMFPANPKNWRRCWTPTSSRKPSMSLDTSSIIALRGSVSR